ncbi:type IV pilus assembly protein PilB [Halanaerobium saccharolyticum]|uniref:Type IV pilus assembly protein PilB n=1 Tax=Halanaerobium saccharolyticum TaxID=43595 RepID=A0A4R7Z651_9FIRM|nr:GspE/PulE family protein [Halanaerobium saccharolyticum]RAK11036.1 type IV pilus assembly protein PilB [Halanaerobium saccharolyticum]TDW06887.1 type IV pilus assembly protein PilB [Halanaerobium saccharolyticum]TDX63652.1 type IV pilus assembly protein PilB [Halanaerobium saccharolyticum]
MQNFCEYLNNRYSISSDVWSKLNFYAKNKKTKLVIDYIKSKKIINEAELLQAMSSYFEIELFRNSKIKLDKNSALTLDLSQVKKDQILIISQNPKIISFGSIYPPDLFLEEKLKFKFKARIKFYLMSENEFKEAENFIYRSYFQVNQQELLKDLGDFKKIDSRDLDSLRSIVEDAPVVKLLNKILTEAISLKASDIHLEQKENHFKVRYRIDGILKSYYSLPGEIAAAVISRIKIISSMDITVRHLPQDGKMEFKFQETDYDIRTSIIPTIYGEKAVLRLLLRNEKLLEVKELNFDSYNLERFKKIFDFNSGIILLSGPTGSGKTTTLFSILNQLAAEKNNIITVENPVEYKLELLNQIEINEAQGLTFPIILRSILRQDPDIIMIGEIRDQETAEIAVRAAVTGHLVLSTIHTIDSISAVSRLIEMGIPPYLISSTLNAVVAQRLLRKLCPECSEKIKISQEDQNIFRQEKIDYIFQAEGCSNCDDGYRGRTPAAEILLINDQLRRLISQEADYSQLKEEALASGMLTLTNSALKKMKKGITTREEILRVIQI